MAFEEVKINYLTYYKILSENGLGDFLNIKEDFNEKLGLKFLYTLTISNEKHNLYFVFKVINESKWFLAKIYYGF